MNKKTKTLLVFDIIFFILASVLFILQCIFTVCFVIEYFKALNPPENATLIGLGIVVARVLYIVTFLFNLIDYVLVLILSIILIKKKHKFGKVALIINIIYIVTSLITMLIMALLS